MSSIAKSSLLSDKTLIMYYIEVVPTDIETFASHIKTYQYSVKENVRTISKKVEFDTTLP